MINYNAIDWLNSLRDSSKTTAIPIMTHPGIELIGKKVVDVVKDGKLHYKAIEALHQHFPNAAAATMIMDLTVEAEAFGAEITFSENDLPSVVGRLVEKYEDVESLEIPCVNSARVPQYIEAGRLAAENMDKPILGGCIGPYSLAGRLFGMTEIMIAGYTEPETITLLLEKCTKFITAYCQEIKKSGVMGVIMAEPAAGLLSNEDCEAFSSKYVREIVENVQDENFAIILHNCGNKGNCTKAMTSVGALAYHFGNEIDMVQALDESPKDTIVMGNLDPVDIFKYSSTKEMEEATNNLLKSCSKYENFVISTGCDVPEVPFENIETFYDTVEKFNMQQ